jgi:hypothetical protein
MCTTMGTICQMILTGCSCHSRDLMLTSSGDKEMDVFNDREII